MAPKDDPETAALKKELNDMIEKFKVYVEIFNANHVRLFSHEFGNWCLWSKTREFRFFLEVSLNNEQFGLQK